MTNNNENEAIGTNEPCVGVTANSKNSVNIEVSDQDCTIVWVDGHGAGKVCLVYYAGKLQDVTVYNGKMSKKTMTDKRGNSHVELKFRGDY